MKRISILIALVFGLATSYSQCGFDNVLTGAPVTPSCPGSVNVNLTSGQYALINVIAGTTYTFTTCGLTGCDTQISLYNQTGTTVLGYNDDACGLQTIVNWTATYTGQAAMLLDQYYCSNGCNSNITVSCTGPPPPPPPPPCGVPTVFNFTGGMQNFVVPAGVSTLTIVAEGAEGGGIGGAAGGAGAVVQFTVPVVAGQVIQMDIGGMGGCPGAGYNGGGIGWASTDGVPDYGSCGGGGATEIMIGGVPIAIAAGGGGAGGGSVTNNPGGVGGCANGVAGGNTYGAGGGGGSQVAGGTGGAPWAGIPPGGSSGTLGTGGMGGLWQTASGGGGGGGYYGGGGGGNDGCCTGANGGGGGGGGSSLVPGGGGCTQGSNFGAGMVTIYVPLPNTMTSPNTATICSGAAVNIPLTSTLAGSTFQWIATANANVTGESTTMQNTATLNNTLVNTTSVPQVVVYTVTPYTGGGTCPGTPQTVNVTVNPPPVITAEPDLVFCAGDNVPLNSFVSTPAGATFTWTNSNTAIGLVASGSGSVPAFVATNPTSAAIVGTITVTPTLGCVGPVEVYTITVNPLPVITPEVDQTYCNGDIAPLNTIVTTPPGGTINWTNSNTAIGLGAGGAGNVPSFTATNLTGAAITANITLNPSVGTCIGVNDIYVITVNPTPMLVDPADQVLCANTNTTAVVFGCMPVIPGVTYNWTNNLTSIGLAGAGVGNIPSFVATNAGTTAAVATITVTPVVNGCTGPSQTFTITVNPIPTVTDPANQTICAGSMTTAVNFVGPVAGTTYNWTNNTPSIGLAAAGVGNIGAFVGLNAGVTSVTATVTVIPTANGCPGPSQNWTYTISPNLVAGADNSATICNSAGSSINLNTLLSGNNATGTWAETTGSGQFVPGTGVFTGSGLTAGTYLFTYTVAGVAPCLNDVANFTVTVSNLPDAGGDNTASLCNSTGTTLNLNTLLLGADAGGTWSETSGVPSGQFTTGTGVLNAAGVPAGTYTFAYTIAPVGPCPGDQAVFTITIEQFVTAGSDNNAFVLCNLPGSLFDANTGLLGNNTVGTWVETTAPPSGQFDPVTGMFDASGLLPGIFSFTYSVVGVAPCTNDQANITLTVEQTALAGLDGSTTICNAPGNTTDLDLLLNGNNAPGTWVETSGSGQLNATTGVFDASGLTAGTYTFTYTVFATPPCANDVADFTVTVEQEALAGLDNSATLCNLTGTTLTLNTLLNGNNAVGVWAETTGSGQFNTATSVFDASGLTAGTYAFTYTVAAVAPCVQDVANFTVTVQQNAQAGLDNTSNICNSAGNTIDLDILLNGNNATGVWLETTAPASGQFNAGTGVLNSAGLTAGNYTFTYTVSAVAPCASDVANFTITVSQEALAGADNAASLCNSAGTTLNLNTLVFGNSGPGTWAETTGSGQFNTATGVFNAAGLGAGSYLFTFTVPAVAPCVADVANFTVTVQQEVTAGADNNAAICNTAGNSININTLLSGNDPGGVWAETTAPASGQFNTGTGILNVGGLTAGAYAFTYTVAAIAPCVLDVANFTVNVNAVPNVGAGADVAVCEGTPVTLSGTGAAGYVWVGGAGINNGTAFIQPVGTTTYTVTGTDVNGCSNTDMVDVTVNVVPVVSFIGDILTGCAPLMVTFDNLSAPVGDNCTWNFGNGVTATGCGQVVNTYTNPGSYNVSLTVTTLQGCSSSATYTNYVTVAPFPVAEFSYAPDEITIDDTEVTFDNMSTDADTYQWTFGDGTATSAIEDPSHIYPIVGNIDYTVQLIAISNAGCADTTELILTVDDVLIFYVPNTFTPDGDDVNNVFLPVFTSGFDIYDYHFMVFNRWGELLFESYDASVGWSGTYGSKGLVADEVYVWRIEFGDNRSDKRHKHHGHVTVLK